MLCRFFPESLCLYRDSRFYHAGSNGCFLGEEKGLAEFNGKPLIQYAIDILEAVCDKIIISANNQLDDYAAFGYEVIEDQVKDIGPMGGLMACLERSDTRYNFVISCDTPFVPADLFPFLLESIENFQVAVPVHHELYFEPLCAVYATNVIWQLQHCIENRNYKLTDFIGKVNAKKVTINDQLPFYHEEMFVNMNTRKDIQNNLPHG